MSEPSSFAEKLSRRTTAAVFGKSSITESTRSRTISERSHADCACWHGRCNCTGLPLREGGIHHAIKNPHCFFHGVAVEHVCGSARKMVGDQSPGDRFLHQGRDGEWQSTTGHGNRGILVGYRYHFNRWLATETVYGYDRNTQEFFTPSGGSRVQANVHQATGGLVVSLPTPRSFRIRPTYGQRGSVGV